MMEQKDVGSSAIEILRRICTRMLLGLYKRNGLVEQGDK